MTILIYVPEFALRLGVSLALRDTYNVGCSLPNPLERFVVHIRPLQQLLVLALILAALLTMSGCGTNGLPFLSTSTPASTSTPIASPTPPTVAGPAGIELDCGTGEATGVNLGKNIAVTAASVSLPQPSVAYVFTAEFGGVESMQTPFYSAVVLYDPSKPLLDPPADDWYFDNVGNVVYGFVYQPGQQSNAFRAVVSDQGWQDSKATQVRGRVDGNLLTLQVPAFEVPPDAKWALVISDGALITCEAIGIGTDDRPALELPSVQ